MWDLSLTIKISTQMSTKIISYFIVHTRESNFKEQRSQGRKKKKT